VQQVLQRDEVLCRRTLALHANCIY
jgi:hypothetical protein